MKFYPPRSLRDYAKKALPIPRYVPQHSYRKGGITYVTQTHSSKILSWLDSNALQWAKEEYLHTGVVVPDLDQVRTNLTELVSRFKIRDLYPDMSESKGRDHLWSQVDEAVVFVGEIFSEEKALAARERGRFGGQKRADRARRGLSSSVRRSKHIDYIREHLAQTDASNALACKISRPQAWRIRRQIAAEELNELIPLSPQETAPAVTAEITSEELDFLLGVTPVNAAPEGASADLTACEPTPGVIAHADIEDAWEPTFEEMHPIMEHVAERWQSIVYNLLAHPTPEPTWEVLVSENHQPG